MKLSIKKKSTRLYYTLKQHSSFISWPQSTGSLFCHILVHAESVFSCFRHPPNSDMDYMIFQTCVHDHSYACVYTRGLGTPTVSQHNIFDSKILTSFSCAPDGVGTSGHRIEPTRPPPAPPRWPCG